MIHLGDITKINGADAPVVDCIIGGSPCQDLSIAGKRAGLAGERSGLYMDQIRIVKEMRAHDKANGRSGRDVRPRYMVWENVPGAFSSNKGRDFAAVIEEAVRVVKRKYLKYDSCKRPNKCKSFELNPIDALWENPKEYRPRKHNTPLRQISIEEEICNGKNEGVIGEH